jgi:hypothetical protein
MLANGPAAEVGENGDSDHASLLPGRQHLDHAPLHGRAKRLRETLGHGFAVPEEPF